MIDTDLSHYLINLTSVKEGHYDDIVSKIIDGRIDEITDRLTELATNEENGWNKLVVYLDLRMRGKRLANSNIPNVVSVVDRSDKPTTFVMIASETRPINLVRLIKLLDLSKSLGVNVVLAIVDKYGDVTYYSLEEINLLK
jgi:tRNA-intron endonuclease